MHHTVSVCVSHGTPHLRKDGLGHLDGELTEFTDDRAEGASLDELHDEEEEIAGLSDRVNGNDVGVTERCSGTGFPPEPLDHVVALEQERRHDLERHFAIEGDVMPQEHGRHPPCSQLGEHLVLAQCGVSQPCEHFLPNLGGGTIRPPRSLRRQVLLARNVEAAPRAEVICGPDGPTAPGTFSGGGHTFARNRLLPGFSSQTDNIRPRCALVSEGRPPNAPRLLPVAPHSPLRCVALRERRVSR